MKVVNGLRKIAVTTLVILIICFAIVMAGGCINVDSTSTSGINSTLADFAKAYETKDINLVKRCLAEEASFYSELVKNARNTFSRYRKIDMELSDITINLYQDDDRATVNLKETFRGIKRDESIAEEIKSKDIFELIKSETCWKITFWYRDIYMREPPNDD